MKSQFSTDSTPSKMSVAYATGVPTFMRRERELLRSKKPNELATRSTMQSAVERYEQLLQAREKTQVSNAKGLVQTEDEWSKMTDLEGAKRRANVKNTHDYICAQIRENVSALGKSGGRKREVKRNRRNNDHGLGRTTGRRRPRR